MLWLVQGDVGLGKIVVVVMVVMLVVEWGKQVVLVVLIELFVEQYLNNLCGWFDFLGVCMVWLVGKVMGKVCVKVLVEVVLGEVQVVVGIYVLMQDSVVFKDLVLVIVDEQYCFGVYQWLVLCDKGVDGCSVLYQLVMIVMLILCMLVMFEYVDLDVLVIDELLLG